MSAAEFDQFAQTYDADLQRALSASGEDRFYFARGRIQWFAHCLNAMGERPRSVLDYGCGDGASASLLLECLGVQSCIGVDISQKSIDVAELKYGNERCRFLTFDNYQPAGDVDVVYCNGVFHHIPPDRRSDAFNYVFRALRPGGFFALWENNPWNPGTRFVMAHCAFDRNAMPISPPQAIRLLGQAGFHVLRRDFLFVFPRILSWLRGVESTLVKLPLGAQFLVLCRRPPS